MTLEERINNGFLSRIARLGINKVFLPLTIASSLFINSCTTTKPPFHEYRKENGTETKKETVLDESVVSRQIRYDIQQEKISIENTSIFRIPVVEEEYEWRTIKKRIIGKARFDEYEVIKKHKLVFTGQEIYTKEETYENKTGNSEVRTIEDRIVTDNNEVLISSNPAVNLSLKLGGNGIGFKSYLISTNKKGIASAEIVKLPYNYAFSRDVLLKKIRSWDKIKGLSPSFVDSVIERINDRIYDSSLMMYVETSGKEHEGFDVVNDSERIPIIVKHVKEKDVYDSIDDLSREKEEQTQTERQNYIRRVAYKLNSSIMTFNIYVEDKISHAKIPADITITSYAPSPESILDDYFSGNELRQALSLVRGYSSSGESITMSTYSGAMSFYLYVPSKYHIRIINPNYHFIEGDIDLMSSDLDRIVRMVDKGTKIRVDIFGSSGGIE